MITVSILAATMCFGTPEQCHPVLLNHTTPQGQFLLTQRLTDDPGYSGDVLQFAETDNAVYAIHRVWTVNKAQNREQRLRSGTPTDRLITNGCINVAPEVYDKLKECCILDTLVITE